MRVEVRGRRHDRRALLARHPDRDHVALNELAEVNAGVETARDQVASGIVLARDVKRDIGALAGELRQPGTQESHEHDGRRDQADDAGRRCHAGGRRRRWPR